MPNITVEKAGDGDLTWLDSFHGLHNGQTVTVPASVAVNGVVKSGTALNVVNESTPAAWTDAAGEQLGFVLFDVPAPQGVDNIPVSVLRHGIIRVANLPNKSFTHATGNTDGFVFVTKEQ